MIRRTIIRVIHFIDPKNSSTVNPIHMVLFLIVALPAIIIYWNVHPIMARIIAFVAIINLVLFFLKLLVKSHYKKDIEVVKKSIPDLNIFHVVMFALIASPFLFFVYAVITAMLE